MEEFPESKGVTKISGFAFQPWDLLFLISLPTFEQRIVGREEASPMDI